MACVWPVSLCNSGIGKNMKNPSNTLGIDPGVGMDPLRQAGPLASPDYSKAVKALVRRGSCATCGAVCFFLL